MTTYAEAVADFRRAWDAFKVALANALADLISQVARWLR
jgi:hypothetical protein